MKPLPAGGLSAVSGLASVCTPLATTSATVTGNVATLVMASNPVTAGFVNGRDVLILAFVGGDTYFNGSFTLTAVNSTQIQFALIHGNGTAAAQGNAVMKPTAAAGCAPLSNVFSDQALSIALTQPFPDDGKGNIQFWASPGTYYVAYSASGINPLPLYPITLGLVPNSSGSLGAVTLGTVTGSTIDISTNTVKNSVNTVGHYPRNNGTQYVDNTIQAADLPATTSNCSGVQFAQGLNAGHTPACATPPTFVASGASHAVGYVPDPGAGAGTTKFLREDATWQTVSGGVSESSLTLLPVGNTNSINESLPSTAILNNNHTIIRFVLTVFTQGVGCSTLPVVALWDATAGSALTSLTVSNSTAFFDSGVISVAYTGGHKLDLKTTTAGSGCGTNAALEQAVAVYQ